MIGVAIFASFVLIGLLSGHYVPLVETSRKESGETHRRDGSKKNKDEK